jgi:hypothetical protein
VALPEPAPLGAFMAEVLRIAAEAALEVALGELFANEAIPKWGGFVEALAGIEGVDLEFFEVHQSETDRDGALVEGHTLHPASAFAQAALACARRRAGFMDEVCRTRAGRRPRGVG